VTQNVTGFETGLERYPSDFLEIRSEHEEAILNHQDHTLKPKDWFDSRFLLFSLPDVVFKVSRHQNSSRGTTVENSLFVWTL
jgi:hypothetical protein